MDKKEIISQESNKRTIGSSYEQTAGLYLNQKGIHILCCNYRCIYGEIDLIAKEGEYIVFCEVKYRKDHRKGHPLEAVDCRKQRVISKCALYYLMDTGQNGIPCRFDVIGILDEEIIHIRNAFEYCF